MVLALLGNGIEAEERKQREFFELAERFRTPLIPKESRAWATGWAE
jgi:hypothetical protein